MDSGRGSRFSQVHSMVDQIEKHLEHRRYDPASIRAANRAQRPTIGE